MKRSPRLRAEWGWIAALSLLFILSFWWFPGRRAGIADSFAANAGGKKAFFDLIRELHPELEVRRHTEGPFPFESADTLCILGPARYPDAGELEDLYGWVRGGKTLIFAARHGDPALDLGLFGVRVEPHGLTFSAGRSDSDDNDVPDGEQGAEDDEDDRESTRRPFLPQEVETDLAEGDFRWQSQGYLADDDGAAEVLLSADGEPQVFYQRLGAGKLVLSCSDYIFSNLSLVVGDNALLAYRIFERGETQGPVYFDESLNASGSPKVIGLLFDSQFRPITLQLLFVALLFGWLGSRRFGAPLPPTQPPRRSIVEHAEALGNLYFKANAGSRVVHSYLDYCRNELRAHYAAAGGIGAAAELARRAGVKEEKVVKLLKEATQVAEGARVSSSRAAALVRALSALKNKLKRAGKGSAR